ncbi:MAG: NifB/NifX family molybdenum-iron cluster-binding protein [Candidatus Edwardsbacteria bacterium]
MKVAVTSQGDSLDAPIDLRFGRCLYFIIVDLEARKIEAIPNPASGATGGAGPQAAQIIADKGVEVVITGNVGPNAFQTLKAANIKVYQVDSGTVKEALEEYKSGKLKESANSSVPGHFGLRKSGKS